VTIEQAGQRAQPQGGAGPGLLGFPPRRLTGGVDVAAVVAAVQADEDVAFPRALAAITPTAFAAIEATLPKGLEAEARTDGKGKY